MRNFRKGSLAACLLPALAACHPGNDGPRVSVPDLAAGTHIVSLGNADAPTIGKYYAAADGARLLVLNDDGDRATALYRQPKSGGKWSAVPAPSDDLTLAFLQSHDVAVANVAVADLAGAYIAAVPGGEAAFTIAADGTVAAGGSACKLSGKLEAGTVPSTLKLTLKTLGCGSLPASPTGVLIVDRDYAPAVFRLLGDDGSQLLDLWAFAA